MSDFLFSSRRRPEGELQRLLESFLSAVTASCIEEHGEWGSLAVAVCPHDVSPMWRDERSISVLLGWPVLHHATGLPPAPVLDHNRRAVVHGLLAERGGIATAGSLDGPFAALTVDRATGDASVVTDRMGFIPLFFSTSAGDDRPLVIGSHVDLVALASGRQRDIDPVAAADFVVHYSITYPHTLYEQVEQFPPAAERSWTPSGWSGPERTYWEPREEPARYLGRAARELRRVFAEAVRHGCEGQDHVGLLLSGGEDSRSVLGAMPRHVRVDAFTYGDWKNREFRIARQVAGIYGAQLHFGQRGPEHYLAYEAVAPLLGTQHRYTDVHGYGLHRELGLPELPIVFGGYLSDALLKANFAHRPKRRLIRPATPLPGERSPPIIANAAGLREDLLREVELRRDRLRERIREMRPFSASEWLVLWPFSMRTGGANMHGGRRLFRDYQPFVSNGVLDIAVAVPQWWKRERLLFHRAMRPFLAPSWHVPHGRSRYPFFGPVMNVPLGAGVKWARWVRDRAAGERGKVQGPWPNLSQLVESPAMARHRDALPLEGSPIAELFRPALDRTAMGDAQRAWTPEQQLIFLQLVHLVDRVTE
jgi:hypothetical protein